jgi:hypothetical protein
MNSDQLKNSTWLIERESQCCFEWRRTKAKSKNWMSLIENSIQFYEQIQLNWEREHVHLGFFNRFQEIRFQIDEQREEFKEKIDGIALAMIDETKKYVAIYLNNPQRHNIVSLRHLTRQKSTCRIQFEWNSRNIIISQFKWVQVKRRLVLFYWVWWSFLTQYMDGTGEIQVLPKMKNPFYFN